MSEKNFHSLFWDMLDHLKTKYLTLDQHLVVDKNLWAPTRLKSVWEDIPRDSEEDILKDKVVSITCRAIGFPQKLLLRLFFSKETTEKISAGLLLYDLQNAFASLASLSDGLFFSVSTAEKVAQAKSIAEFGFEATTEVLDQLNPQKDDVPIFDYLKKEIELRILNLDLVVQKKHPIQSQLNDELTQGLSIKEGKIRIEEAINQARVELEWLQQVVRDWDSNVALLKRQFQEDIHDAQAVFMTADEFFSTIDRNDEPWFDQLVGLGAAQKTEQLAEFASWDKEAHNVFYDQYGGAASEVENQKNGIENGTLDAFRHLYSSAKWALLKGDNWSQELFDGIKHKEWAHSIDPVGEARMDLWNNHVGRIIGQQARKELGSFRAAGDKSTYLQQADVYIAKLTRAAIETGLAASSIEDPRLKVLDIDIVGSDTRPWSLLNLSIKSLFNSVQGGLETDIPQLLRRYLDGQTTGTPKWEEITDSVVKAIRPAIAQNNVHGGKNRTFFFDEAHAYMQLINWSALGKLPPGVGFDPKKDPFPEDPDRLDDYISRNFELKERFEIGYVKGSVFKAPGLGFFMVFDDPENKILEGIRNAKLGEGIDGVFRHFIDPAYRVYRRVLETYRNQGISNDNLVLMGYSGGGAIASALSAALHMGAFTEDSPEGGYGHYDAALAAYGWSLNDAGKIIDNRPAVTVNALTFNAPPMGWIFQKPVLEGKEDDVNSYRFVYPEKDVAYLERTKEAPVTNFGMVEDKYFSQGRPKFRIGKNEYLFKEDGKLPYVEGAIDWHDLDTLELAFQEAPKQEEDPEKPGEGPRKPGGGAPSRPTPEEKKDPLILDLNRDGKVSTTPGKRYFDLDANGVAERVSWAASGDGFLAMDRDGDGKITSGRELFGDHTVMSDGRVATSGFQALADLDGNKDGKIDASDEAFGRLRVWSDKDGNGKFEDHELSTLEETGIESIDLRYSDHRTEDENGNQIVRTGRFTWKDGDRGKVSEFLLERDTIHSLAEEKLDEPDEVAALPDLPQRGFLYSLHQAMVRDGSGELRKLTERFAGEKDSVARRSLLDRILLKWSEVSNVETTPNGGWLGFLEKFYGARYDWSSLTERGRRQLESAYESVSLYLYGNLLRQSHYADELKMLDYDMDDTGRIFLSTRRALESLAREHAADPDQLKRSLGEFFLVLKTAGLYEYVDESEVESHAALLSTYGSELPDVCRASYLAMKEPVGTYMLPYFVSGRGGTLDGDIHSNVLVGSEEADILRGGHGSDVLMGGRGSDTLVGGEDGDTYVWNLGDGDDRIVNSSTGSGEEDVLRLGKGDDTLKLCA